MEIIDTLTLALALAMDAFAVALATGLCFNCSLRQSLRMSFAFGGFQFLMPVAGWFLGYALYSYVNDYGHWVAFAVLVFIGQKMFRDGLKKDDPQCAIEAKKNPTAGFTLLVLAFATSVDAFAVGVSLALLASPIWLKATVIGVVCFALTLFALFLAGRLKEKAQWLGKKANLLGGIILFLIALQIVIEKLNSHPPTPLL